MVLRYITGGTNRKNAHSMQPQAEALLKHATSVIHNNDNDDYYDELMQLLHKYPSDVVCSCHDHMGNTILHMIFSRRQRCKSDTGTSSLVDDFSASTTNRRRSQRRGRSSKGNDITKRKVTLLQLVHYLTYCSDSIPNEFTNDEPIMGTDVNVVNPDPDSNTGTSPTSLIRQKSAGGSLPLHMACRFRYPNEQQQLDVIQNIIEAYPDAVQCHDMWGNLPLHDACDVNSSSNIIPPIEIIILLIQIYPESVRIKNMDGNLPLHLIARASKNTFTLLTEMGDSFESMNDCKTEEINDFDPKGPTCNDESSHELRQLEIVEHMVGYWPESVHITNNRQQTALQQALLANTNASLLEFLQLMAKKIDPRLTTLPTIATLPVQNLSDVNDIDGMMPDKTPTKTLNPFDDDCETLNTTMNLSRLSDEVAPDVQFPWNIIENINTVNNDNENDEDSETDFDGVVELAEDYFEVMVVDHAIRHHSDNQDHINETIGSMEAYGDLCFNNCNHWTSGNYEDGERFFTPFR